MQIITPSKEQALVGLRAQKTLLLKEKNKNNTSTLEQKMLDMVQRYITFTDYDIRLANDH